MLTTRTKWSAVRALAILALAALPVFANPIFVSNFSFEQLPVNGLPLRCDIDCYSNDNIPGWTAVGATGFGQVQPGPAANGHFNTLSDGPTSAYSNGGVISQTVVPGVVAGQVYTLLVDIGSRLDYPTMGSAALLINGNSYLATGTFVLGAFSTFTATYTGTVADAGQSITIDLMASGVQGNFDNVQLADSNTPEPVPFILIGTALLVFPVLRIRRTNPKNRA